MFPSKEPQKDYNISPSTSPFAAPSSSPALSFLTSSTTDHHPPRLHAALPMIPPTQPTVLAPSALTFSPSSRTRLGEGASGAVYRGTLHASPVAVKVCARTALAEKQFWREVECLHAVRHPNIINFYGVATVAAPFAPDPDLAVVVELCHGGSLHAALVRASKCSPARLPFAAFHRIATHVAGALAFLHAEKKIVHRDLKPLNVLLTHPPVATASPSLSFPEFVTAKLCDFGLSKPIPLPGSAAASADAAKESTTGAPVPEPTEPAQPQHGLALRGSHSPAADTPPSSDISSSPSGSTPTTPSQSTASSVSDARSPSAAAQPVPRHPSSQTPDGDPGRDAPGTYEYLAPEHFGDAPVAPSGDIFALGMLLYQMLTLRSPWPGKKPWQIFNHVYTKQERPPWPAEGVSVEWRNLVEMCWAQDHADRPSAQEVVKVLSRLRTSSPVDERQELVWADPSDAPQPMPSPPTSSDSSDSAGIRGEIAIVSVSAATFYSEGSSTFQGPAADQEHDPVNVRLDNDDEGVYNPVERDDSEPPFQGGLFSSRLGTDQEIDSASNDSPMEVRDRGSQYDSQQDADRSDADYALSDSPTSSSGDDDAASVDTVDSLLDGLGIRHVMSQRLDALEGLDLANLGEEGTDEENAEHISRRRPRRRLRRLSRDAARAPDPDIDEEARNGGRDGSLVEEPDEESMYLSEPHAPSWRSQAEGPPRLVHSVVEGENISVPRDLHRPNGTDEGLDLGPGSVNPRADVLQVQSPVRSSGAQKAVSPPARHSRTVSLPPDMHSQLHASSEKRSGFAEARGSHSVSCDAVDALLMDPSLHVDDQTLADLVGIDFNEPFPLCNLVNKSAPEAPGFGDNVPAPECPPPSPAARRQVVEVEEEKTSKLHPSTQRSDYIFSALSMTEQEILEELEYLSESLLT